MPDLRLMIYQAMMWKRHKIRLEANRNTHELRYIFFEVSRRCNIHCSYCGSDCSSAERDGELSSEEWISIIDQLAEDFDPRRVMVAVTGGEPLFKRGIYDIFEHLHRRGFPYGMVTNSTLLDAEAARRLVSCGMNSISLSLDSIPEVNDSIRAKGTARHAVEAIGHLRAAGYKGVLEALSTITKPCMPHLREMQQWLTELGIRRWRVAPVIPVGRALDNESLLLSESEVRELLSFVRQARRFEDDVVPEFSEEGYVGDDYEGLVRPYLCQCRAGINVGGIRYDGKIGACPEISSYFDQGDIRKERFSTVWRERFANMRDRSWARSLGPCRQCDKFDICRGGALHLYEDTRTPTRRCFHEMLKQS